MADALIKAEYFAHYSATHRPGSVTRHRTSWHAVAPVLGDKRLDEITPLDLERYRHKRKQAGKSDVSINRELGFLRHVFSMAIDWDQAVENSVKNYASLVRTMVEYSFWALMRKHVYSPIAVILFALS